LKADDEVTSLMQFFKKGYMAGKLLNVLKKSEKGFFSNIGKKKEED
jgi:hypothetical protein